MRLVEQHAFDPAGAYHPVNFLADVRGGIWSELGGSGAVQIDAYRRNLQRAYVDTLAARVNGRTAAVDDARALFRAELSTLDRDINGALGRTNDPMTRAHLEDIRMVLARALDPTVRDAPASGPAGFDAIESLIEEVGCWPDYAIRN